MKNQRGSQAELASQFEQIKSRLLQLEARVEERNIQAKRIQDEQAALKQNTNSQLEQLRGQMAELNSKVTGVNAQVATVSDDFNRIQENRAKEAAERAAVAAKAADEARKKADLANTPRTIEPEQTKKKSGHTEEAAKPEETTKPAAAKTTMQDAETNTSDTLYNKGLAAYKANKYKEAYNAFSSYLEKNRTAPLAPNARYWLGECLFQQKEFELAILEYQKVIADYPKSNKAPAALFKQGQAFEKLSEKETAKIVYNKLLADYPKSEQFEMAQKRLKELK
ncbi:MAG: tol-pal system protein YbgF, partial [Desulfurivibrionaceae bacterium]|jgi:tol-pal system protein YbgF